MRIVPSIARLALVAAVVALAVGAQAAFTAGPSAPSSVITVDPVRILDTRIGLGAPTGPVGASSTISVQVAGANGIPADATGIIVTLTATQATQNSFLTAWPSGIARPTVSVLNFRPNESIANTVTLSLGSDGRIDLFNNAGSVHFVADVVVCV